MSVLKSVRALAIATALIAPAMVQPAAQAQISIGISVHIPPPALPVYVQPPLPAPGYLWTPGYWGYNDDGGYYWVPGVWVQPPSVGVLWTPGYWGYEGGLYGWHGGYWGPHIGFYGGVNYGFGYGGIGFCGGEWRGGVFAYNHAVANFGSVHVTNVYVDRDVVVHNTIVNVNHTSFNGPGGVARQPSPQEQQAAHENHIQPTPMQQQHFQAAAHDPAQRASVNGGHPATPAASSPAAYHQVAQQHAATAPAAANHGAPGGSAAQAHPAQPASHGASPAAAPQTHAASRPAPAAKSAPRAAPKSAPKQESEHKGR